MFLCVRYSMLDEKEKNCERYLYQNSYICPSSFSSLLCFFVSIILFFLSTRPWDPLNDLIQFEKDGCIQTKVRHRTPMVRSGSLISLSNQGPRRDNCKCQVGCPNRKPLWSNASRRLSHLPSMHLKAPCAPPSLWLLCVVFAVLPPPSSLLLHFIVMFFFLVPPPLFLPFLLFALNATEGLVRLHAVVNGWQGILPLFTLKRRALFSMKECTSSIWKHCLAAGSSTRCEISE